MTLYLRFCGIIYAPLTFPCIFIHLCCVPIYIKTYIHQWNKNNLWEVRKISVFTFIEKISNWIIKSGVQTEQKEEEEEEDKNYTRKIRRGFFVVFIILSWLFHSVFSFFLLKAVVCVQCLLFLNIKCSRIFMWKRAGLWSQNTIFGWFIDQNICVLSSKKQRKYYVSYVCY